MNRARMIQIIAAVLILIAFCIGVFFWFGSSTHVKQAPTAPSSGQNTAPSSGGTAPYTTVPPTGTVPDSTTGPTPAP